MARYTTQIKTSMPRNEVFSDLIRFDRAASWDPGVISGVMLTDEPVGPGSRFALEVGFLGRSIRLEYEIVDFAQDARVQLRAQNRFVRSTDTISFSSVASEPAPTATLVRYDAQLQLKGVARIVTPLLAVAFRGIGDRAAAGLRARLTSGQPV